MADPSGSDSAEGREYRVRQVAELSGVTVRTLHHYDAIGLLTPCGRSTAGYRLYGVAELERLQEILFYRELDIPLEQIATLLDDPSGSRRATLVAQRQQLRQRRNQLERLLNTIDRAIEDLDEPDPRNETMNEHQQDLPSFDGFDPARYEQETAERWGDTEAYAVSRRRTQQYGREDWQRLRRTEDEIAGDLARLLSEGIAPDDGRARELAERHRLHIDAAYYPCSHAMHAALSELYTEDPRFREHWEQIAEGLAAFVQAAIRANAAAAETNDD